MVVVVLLSASRSFGCVFGFAFAFVALRGGRGGPAVSVVDLDDACDAFVGARRGRGGGFSRSVGWWND